MEFRREWEGHEREITDYGALFLVSEYDAIPLFTVGDTKEVNITPTVFILILLEQNNYEQC